MTTVTQKIKKCQSEKNHFKPNLFVPGLDFCSLESHKPPQCQGMGQTAVLLCLQQNGIIPYEPMRESKHSYIEQCLAYEQIV